MVCMVRVDYGCIRFVAFSRDPGQPYIRVSAPELLKVFVFGNRKEDCMQSIPIQIKCPIAIPCTGSSVPEDSLV